MNDLDKILKNIKNNILSPLYFLCGDEPFFIDQVADCIEKNALPEAEKAFNQSIVYGKGASIVQVLEKARCFPMMGNRQVIIVKEAQNLTDFKQKNAQERLSVYAENPQPATVLVFCYKHKKPDARTQMYKTLKKNAVVLEAKKMYDNQLPSWLTLYCKSKNCTIAHKAATLLVEYIGNNLSGIANAIDKILTNFPEQNVQITDHMVSTQVGISKEFNLFELQTAFAQKNSLKVYQILNYFASNPKNNPAIVAVSVLFNYFTKVLLVHSTKKSDNKTLAALLKVNPYFVREYLLAAKNYSLPKTLQIIALLQTADLQLKGVESVSSDEQILKELAFKLLN